MSKPDGENQILFYTVCFPEYDSWTLLHGRLYEVRRDFFESALSSQETIMDYSEGLPAKYSHSISRWGMRWKKRLNGQLREYSCFDADGCAIVLQDEEGRAYGKLVFGRDLNWTKSYYYLRQDATHQPQFLLERDKEENTVTLIEYSKDNEEISAVTLFPCPFFLGTAEQSLLNSKIGQPRVCAATSQGDFCYYTEERAKEYCDLLDRIQNGEQSLNPVWSGMETVAQSEEPDWYHAGDDQEKTYARQDPEGKTLPPLEELGSLRLRLFQPDGTEADSTFEDSFSLEEQEWNRQNWMDEVVPAEQQPQAQEEEPRPEHTVEGMPKLETAPVEPFDPPDSDKPSRQLAGDSYAANRELFHVDVQKEEDPYPDRQALRQDFSQAVEQPDNDVREIIEIIQHMEGARPAPPKHEPESEPEYSEEMKALFASGKLPSRYTVAGKKSNSNMVHAPTDMFRKTEEVEITLPSVQEKSDPMFATITAAKRIVISAEESYLYFGQVIDGLRQGKGRTQTEDGLTAYDGHYRDDMRDGFGAYYYKSGKLCYAGDWRSNKRDGVGVSFQSSEGAIHVGRWKEDKPIGASAVFDQEGNLQFAGNLKNGERHGAGVAYRAEDGTVFVGKWKNDLPTGQGSAFDQEGNLIYTGMWQNGKRHGTGTEFSSDGHVVFTGEWKNDEYLSGILYKRVENPQE